MFQKREMGSSSTTSFTVDGNSSPKPSSAANDDKNDVIPNQLSDTSYKLLPPQLFGEICRY